MKEQSYKVVDGISFHPETPDKVCRILANYCGDRNQRVRIFLGDNETGKDWLEVWKTIGYIGRSTGIHKIPLMILRKDSLGGGAILDDCIVKITVDKQIVYRDSIVFRDRVQTQTVEVEKKLTGWQQAKLRVGGFCFFAVILIGLYFIITFLLNLKRF